MEKEDGACLERGEEMTHFTQQELELLRIRNPHVRPEGEPVFKEEPEEFESRLQAKCTDWLRKHGIKYIHVQGRKNRAGILDLYCFMPKARVVIFELKGERGGMSTEQEDWVRYLNFHEYEVHANVRSFKRFLEVMEQERKCQPQG